MIENPFRLTDDELKAQQIEFKIHCAAIEQIPGWFPGIKFLHIPNRPGDGKDGYFKKMMGATAGASDLLLGWKVSVNAGAGYIEIKAPGEKLRTNQNHFLSGWATVGFKTGTAWSCRDIHRLICQFGVKPASHAIWEPDIRSDGQKKADSFDYFAPR